MSVRSQKTAGKKQSINGPQGGINVPILTHTLRLHSEGGRKIERLRVRRRRRGRQSERTRGEKTDEKYIIEQ